jgi:nifR3 family TIM-barrel protein
VAGSERALAVGDTVSVLRPPVPPRPLPLGGRQVWPPVVLAPMAGITGTAFRRMCREYGAGVYVSEMVTSRALLERDRETMRMIAFDADESPRSLQLYGVDPVVVGAAVRMVVAEDLADHVDLNFGCPVPKVTRKGGGSALPYKRRLFGAIVAAAVRAASGTLPVTVKMRKGIDDEHLTYLDAGRIAQDAGAAWVALHARTAAQLYSGRADWDAIGELTAALDVPVLGNGDLWEATDALRMMQQTGCHGVVVGRGCLGRPWLFGDLAAAFDSNPDQPARPGLTEVARVMRRHAELLAAEMADEGRGCRDFRKHVAWYLKGFRVGSEARRALAMVASLAELDELLAGLDLDQPFPDSVTGLPRGRITPPRAVALPDHWLDDPGAEAVPAADAELALSGG